MCSRTAIALVCAAAPAIAQGKVFLRIEQATKLAFPGAKIERKTVFLTKSQQKRIGKLAGEKYRRGLVFPYVATKKGKLVGTAYVDVHRVRTKSEAVMIVVTPDGRVGRVEPLAFAEPVSYMAPKPWYRHLDGKKLDKNLRLKGAIKGVTGATLTAKATTRALRRTLAVHRVLQERVLQEKPEPKKDKQRKRRESTPPRPRK